jgi:D-3-phosphoglycerate dehydrogenase
MSLPFKILIAETENFSSQAIAGLKEIGNVVQKDIEQEELINALSVYDVIWVRLKFTFKENDFPKDCITKYIICPVTGLDHIDLEACARRDITVISLKDEVEFLRSIRATAEHTIALTLSLLRKLSDAIPSVKKGNWKRDLFKGEEIYEKKVGILGVGRLGAITASYFKAFGAKVYGYDIKEFDTSICEKANSMNELFQICDIITIHVDLNPKTKNLVGINQFNKMNKNSFIINTSRGAIVNESDLLYALDNKLIAGAAIDVLENEYEITNNILIRYANNYNNLLITPHIGGNTKESFEKTEMYMLQKFINII